MNRVFPRKRRALVVICSLGMLAAGAAIVGSVVVTAETEQPTADSDAPANAIRQARKALFSTKTISARVSQKMTVGGRTITLAGQYQQATNLRFRLELEWESRAKLLQVCDGGVVWTRTQMGKDIQLTRRDVLELLNHARKARNSPSSLIAQIGIGGLPGLLASLDSSVEWEQLARTKSKGRKLVVVEGAWKDSVLAEWKANPKQPLPADFPKRIRIYLDAETMLPMRIQYRKHDPTAAKKSIPFANLDFSEVVLNQAIEASRFEFVPPDGLIPKDVTGRFLQRIRASR